MKFNSRVRRCQSRFLLSRILRLPQFVYQRQPVQETMVRDTTHEECPICMERLKYGVETNCGHLYCAECFNMNWQRNFTTSPMPCPYCRQNVTLLIPCFTDAEANTSGLNEEREGHLHNIQTYNRLYSEHPRSMVEQLRDLPILLRHMLGEMLTWRGLEMLSRMRVIICLVVGVLYAITPIDLVPEAFLGIIGLLDDLVVVIFLLIQVSIVYRNVVTNRDW
ncbi:E3 ubiquitin-protein ligase RNF170-like isoform X3 [Oratosquilla oratoria]|uniref:E3 ubiquitin-protein ligase RNF170-like isoform X3 n=1 Tax=Oratosquilla oratoria TaxID=337810 RepID=UPI003F765606